MPIAPATTRAKIGNCTLFPTAMGLGSAPLGNLYTTVSDQDAHDVLQTAWDAGCRIFDTAPLYGYGLAERRVGDFLRSKPRNQFLLSTKVGRMLQPRVTKPPVKDGFVSPMPFNYVYDYSYDAAMRSMEDSLQRLGLDRVDIALIHDVGVAEHGDRQPELFTTAMQGAAKALSELRAQGTVAAIGMGMNEWEVCQASFEHIDFDAFLLAGRYTLLEQLSLASFLPLCEQRGVKILLGGAFNSGILVAENPAQSTYNYAPADEQIIAKAVAIQQLCQQFDVPMAAAALQFPLAHPAIASIILGARAGREVSQALAWFEHSIPNELWTQLQETGLIDSKAPLPTDDA